MMILVNGNFLKRLNDKCRGELKNSKVSPKRVSRR